MVFKNYTYMLRLGRGDFMGKQTLYFRKRVNTLLKDIEHYSLTVLVASTGYGKTTVIKQYLSRIKKQHVYVNLTSASESAFWQKLCTELRSAIPVAAQRFWLGGIPQDDLAREEIIAALRQELKEPLLLVIDDCQILPPNSSVWELITTLVLENLPNLHLVLLAQTMPPLQLATLVFKNTCLLLGREDLAFTREEIKEYLELNGLRVNEEGLETIYHKSNGWIAMIFIMCQGLRHRKSDYAISTLNQMFEENFLGFYSQPDRDILVRLAMLEQFTLELAVSATGKERSATLLTSLERNNAFLIKDEQDWYSFHALLKDYLMEQCPRDEEQKQFYFRVGRWYLEREAYPLALHYYHLAERLMDFFAAVEGVPHWGNNCPNALEKLIPEIKALDWKQYPTGFLQVAFALLRLGKEASNRLGLSMLKTLEVWAMQHHNAKNAQIQGDCILIQTILGLYKDDDWNQHFKAAAQILREQKSMVLLPSDPITFGLPMFVYLEYRKPGVLATVVEQDSHCPLENIVPDFGHGMDLVIQAEAALLRCELEEAKHCAKQALIATHAAGQYFLELCAEFTLLRIKLLQGERLAALQQMEELRAAAIYAANTYQQRQELYRQVVELSEVFLNLALPRLEKIPDIYVTRPKGVEAKLMDSMGIANFFRAKVAYLRSDFSTATVECELVLELGRKQVQHSQLIRLSALVLKAKTEEKLLKHKQALELLTTAVKEAALDDVCLPFVESAEEILVLLAEIKPRGGVSQGYMTKLIKLCKQQKTLHLHQQRPLMGKCLSARELETLTLAAQGLNQNQIAEQMQVKAVTVKKHLISVYAKLGVNNKVLAIEVARTLKLL